MFFKKKNPSTTKQTEVPAWEKIGLSKEQYDEALTVIYGPKDGDFTSYLNRPTSSSSVQMKQETDSVAKQNANPLPNESHYVSLKSEAQKVPHGSTSPASPVNDSGGELEKYLKALDRMVGLQPVKEMIHEIVDDVKMRKEREMFGQKMPLPSLNMMFTGNPGTGKTTVAQLVGKIMKAAGVLEKGHFVSATRADLVVDYIGGTAKKTKATLQKALGGILFIDEAYSLARGGEQDFGKEAVDTIVEFIENHKGKILVIMAGYTEEMKGLTKVNTGIQSRFQNIIEFPDYSAEEMIQLARFMARKYQVRWNTATEKVMLEVFNRKQIKGRSDSGNGRLVRNELEAAIRRQSKRLANKQNKTKEDVYYLLPSDFAFEKERSFDLEKELAQIVGKEELKNHIRSLAATVKIQKMRKEKGLPSSQQSLHMVFKGNPGTGKTTIARILGELFKELQIVKKGHLVEVSQSDLIGSYVGQTAPKTKEKIQEALGGILFIDEAYALKNNEFGQDAIDELVKMMEDNKDELIVILAGYNREMDEFMQTNSGLASRFPVTMQFNDYNEEELKQLFVMMAKRDSYHLTDDAMFAISAICKVAIKQKQQDTGNGRMVRNILDQAKRYQAERLLGLNREPSVNELQELNITDFKVIGEQLLQKLR
ncbi:AAA family ATPase [Cytobacillus oceanisediminis]|uniref:AAA family ATPase n=1 Tax=Cytobacillus oceanisediminis TaxID=665099 RepID=UPI00254FBFC7|nr:AAA family ATPase [Cytobacillus oceanisediminis]MDK7667388.1 AAA family ATPase [Cytobacillus oceanisediminis]